MGAPTVDVRPAGLSTPTPKDVELRSAARVAGAGTLGLAVLSGFGVFIATRGLVTEGDPAQTAHDIMKSQGLFRAGILSLVVVVALDVVVAAALYRMLRPANETIARIATWLRLIYAAGFLV